MKTKMNEKQLHNSKGVALVTTLLLLSLFSVMTLAMVIATSSDTLINGYYRNFRGSFYAADSGINAARQYVVNQFSAASLPVDDWSTLGATIVGNLTNTSTGFGAYKSVLGTQQSWNGSFKVDSANTYVADGSHPADCTPTYTGGTPNKTCIQVASDGTLTVTAYTYHYPYKITVVGQSNSNEANTITEMGTINVTVPVNSTTTTETSFAAYGTLFDRYAACSAPFVKGTMTGPFFSNESWNFGDNGLVGSGSYIFTDTVGAADPYVGYMYSDSNHTCHQSASTSDSNTVTTTSGSGRHRTTTTTTTTIAPNFQGGLLVDQDEIPLPEDTFSQQRAVLDGLGNCAPAGATQTCTNPTQADRAGALRSVTSGAWPSSGSEPSSGVYVPYSTTAVTGCSTPPCFTGGGIYVQGNADQVTLTAGTSGTDKTQIFTIKQGSTTTTVTVNLTAGTTTIADNLSHSSGTITGVPMNKNSSTEAALLYVNGSIGTTSGTITGLSGPSSGPAIQNDSAVTVTSTGNIVITGNIKYSTEPVTLTQQGSTPAGTLIPGATNVLGIYTSGGDIQLKPPTSVTSLQIDASLAMIHDGGSGGLVAQWNHIGTLTIVGGRIANLAKSGSSLDTRNIWFDRRFSQGGFAPPWFPSTEVTTTGTGTPGDPEVSASRVSWVNTSAQ